MAKITGVTFKPGGKVYYFAPGKGNYRVGMGVIVETAHGAEYGEVAEPLKEVPEEKLTSPLKPIIRIATPKDEEIHKRNGEKRADAMKTAAEKIKKLKLDMKLIDCEFSFDGTKAVFYYSSPQRVDFRGLVKELSQIYKIRIELRQVNLREEIKLIGGLAPCGRECCCTSCLPDVKKVSIKMAKNQGLSLNPGKIAGLCGRLMCCVSYESEYYEQAIKKMPKMGAEVSTPDGKGTVINLNMLKMTVKVRIEDKERDFFVDREYPVEKLKFKNNRKGNREDKDGEEERAD